MNFQTTKIASSLQEMQITSPLGANQNGHLLKLSPHPAGQQQQAFIIGSAPSDMASYLSQQQAAANNSNVTLSFLQQHQQHQRQQQQQQPMEFGECINLAANVALLNPFFLTSDFL